LTYYTDKSRSSCQCGHTARPDSYLPLYQDKANTFHHSASLRYQDGLNRQYASINKLDAPYSKYKNDSIKSLPNIRQSRTKKQADSELQSKLTINIYL
jgi:hypothetical protein